MDFATQTTVCTTGIAASVVFDVPWQLKYVTDSSSVGGTLAYPSSQRVSRFPVEVLLGGDGCIGVNGRVLQRCLIYASSQARAVRSMLFPIDWDDKVCAGLSSGVLRFTTYEINSLRF